MNSYKKTLWGSIISFIIGTSCCWLSSLAIWFGGAVFLSAISIWIEDKQILIISLSILLLIISIVLYFKKRKKKQR